MFHVIRFVYSVGLLPALFILLNLMALFNSKIREALKERYLLFSKLEKWKTSPLALKKTILIHAASMGEFEHIKPIIYELKKNLDVSIVLTFFSPSGYNHVKIFPGIDLILYNPFDFQYLWRKFFRLIRPCFIIISKHDAWPNQVWTARDLKIPIYLVNASLAESSTRILPIVKWFLGYVYESFERIYASSEAEGQRFKKYFPASQVGYLGDTKFDQVLVRKERAISKKHIKDEWFNGKTVLILGSVWKEDAQPVFPALKRLLNEREDLRIILVPHQPNENFLSYISNFFGENNCRKFVNKEGLSDEPVLVVDVVGLLAELYKYAQVAYVGGSFKQGIHNVMEAAVYGIPVLYGPKYQNSTEAINLLNSCGSFVTESTEEFFMKVTQLLDNHSLRRTIGDNAKNFAMLNLGATNNLINEWNKHFHQLG